MPWADIRVVIVASMTTVDIPTVTVVLCVPVIALLLITFINTW